ncbi:phosphotransferase [Fictibacillus barbaricus]|uniref:Aminoglycoside phosphotransferase (APT) family kinase protein n=1 Tax=Fictibacillus barbaricus TaxID=182136 RepID=A0ABU1TX67_9BACL|nr:phosphotransferase [Fictibacillus barbaricus]MDR7071774.1 aminoglycoside phosphotransferase (APT) family kinase protein [Fictibacillus barbaricus]
MATQTDFKIEAELVKKLLDEQFSKLSSMPIKKLGEGLDNTVYLVGEEFVFRFPRNDSNVPGLMREGNILPKLESIIDLPYPKPVFYGEKSEEYPFPFLGYPYMRGKFPIGLSDEQRSMSAETLAQFLRTLHNFPLDKARELGLLNDARDLLNIQNRKEYVINHFMDELSLHLEKNDYELLSDYLNQLETGFVQLKEVFLHGDLHFKNIMVDEAGKISGIIDWGDMGIGHPACDLSAVYSILPPQARKAFYKVYGEADEETKVLARFIAVFIAMVLLLQAMEDKDDEVAAEAKATIKRAISN